ncbi:MAG: NAD+ synthase [Alphaproteobacteria bacterium]|nr:NAD+ synthase [Alphaproteobacteria bacterium]
MTDSLAIAVAQTNPTVGAIGHNIARIRAARAEAAALDAELVVMTELVVSGYPPEDLVLKPAFLHAAEAAVGRLAEETADGGPALLISSPWRIDGRTHSAAILLDAGQVAGVRAKHDLPNYGVFDEKRVFAAGPMPGPINFRGVRLGVMTCEDMWTPAVAECLAETGAELLIVLNGSPFESEKIDQRLNLAVARVRETGLPLIYANQVGGQDELVFDGASFALDPDCRLRLQLPAFREFVALGRWQRGRDERWRCTAGVIERLPEGLESVYAAMVLGLRDYVGKSRFPGVVIGLSGGIDSALTAACAVDALGADQVRCVMMPSRFTSQDSLDDAADCAKLLGIRLDQVAIEPAVAAFDQMLAGVFQGLARDVTEENIQARIRGLLLMAVSNKTGFMVVTTGNKSEMSAGYATLYGDMCGGYSVLKDVYKTMVFALSHWRNQHRSDGLLGPAGRVIPERVITKAPSAELRPDQKDEDSLPKYANLDAILDCLVEHELPVEEILAKGFAREDVARVQKLLYVAEYKRRQAPPGVKITSRAFGRDRRYPITNGFRETL